MKKKGIALKMTESAMMIALATILSIIPLVELPYGGNITLASMLPILVIAYRHGPAWGFFTGLVHGTIQLLLGSRVLSYVTGAASVAAIIVLDYILAFALIGLGGLSRKIANPKIALPVGALIAGVSRYACHVVSGCTVWAGLSIPTTDALGYSFIYNATYMLPETIVIIIAAYYIASAINFRTPQLTAVKDEGGKISIGAISSGAVICAALIYDIVAVFSKLQNSESGEFDITAISQANWPVIGTVTLAAVLVSVVLCILLKPKQR